MSNPSKTFPALPPIPKFDGDLPIINSRILLAKPIGEKRLWFEKAVEMGCDSLEINIIHSNITDQLIVHMLNSIDMYKAQEEGIAVLALGGYGRKEMGLFCDIDLLFLHDSKRKDAIPKIAEAILYPFWDSGVEIGGATRTIGDCESIIHEDKRAFTAMLDARLIAGDRGLYDELIHMLQNYLSRHHACTMFIENRLKERSERLKKFGDTIYLLEPNIKESEGGLRDYHTLMWIARAAYMNDDHAELLNTVIPNESGRQELTDSLRYLWSIRHILHLIEGKRSDRLSDAIQPKVAERMGFSDKSQLSATEQLMSLYYEHASSIYLRCARAIERIEHVKAPKSRLKRWILRKRIDRSILRTEDATIAIRPEHLKNDPTLVLRAFAVAKEYSLPIDPETKDIIAHLKCEDYSIESGKDTNATWKRIFSSLKGLDKTLSEMQECHCLPRLFPEMTPMLYLLQRDGFHIYTSGVHSIKAVSELCNLITKRARQEFPTPTAAMKLVARPHVLALATLFHDIGKGRGGRHSDKGASLVADIAKRLGYPERDVEDIAFLVRSHLVMSKLAFRRDIHDPGLVERFAQSMRSPEMAAMLYLLTFADIRAVGPNVWNNWKSSLLSELYRQTITALTKGKFTGERRKREAERKIGQIRRNLGRDFSKDDVESHINALPERYLFSMTPETIAAHILMTRELDSVPVTTTYKVIEDMGCSELSVITKDKPGLFSEIAGILTASGANIVNASLHTTSSGTAVDVIWITDYNHRPIDDPELLERIRRDMVLVITGKSKIELLVGGKFKRRLLTWTRRYRTSGITIDNDVSTLETVIEISADDRRGLLYTITSIFHELGLTIDKAMISTQVDRVTDVFYIRDSKGQKISSQEELSRIKDSLHQALEE